MLITAIQVRSIENTGTKLRGIASLTLDGMIVIHEIKILENQGQMFLAMPSKTTKSGFKDIVHPINSAARGIFEKLIIKAYQKTVSEGNGVMELLIREESKEKDFLELEIDDYMIGRTERAEEKSVKKEDRVSAKKVTTESSVDEDILKWLQG